jgi:hypothetical protein
LDSAFRASRLLVFATVAIGFTADVKQWEIHEEAFRAERESAGTPVVEYRHSGGRILKLEAFRDGDRTWKVRFAPPLEGAWTWRTLSADPGLSGRSGSLRAIAPTAQDKQRNRNFHGHLRVSADRRYFRHDDGFPFLWLGDTVWSLSTRRCGTGGPFFTWLRDRREKGFSVLFTQLFEPRQQNEGGLPFTSYDANSGVLGDVRPEYFQALDVRMDALWQAGFVVAAHPTWVGKQNGYDLESIARAFRYLMARYGAYNVVWSLSGEYQYSYTNAARKWSTDDWEKLGRAVQSWNAYRHPLSVHPSGRQDDAAPAAWPRASVRASSAGEFHQSGWLDHNWLQTGQSPEALRRIPERIAQNITVVPRRPVIHSEGLYENQRQDGASAAAIRWQAWVAMLSGAAGHGYGAAGLWQFFDPADETCCGKDRQNSKTWDNSTWRTALAYEGGAQLIHLRRLLETMEWWRLRPDPGAAPWLFTAAIDGEQSVTYVPAGNRDRSVELRPSCARCQALRLNPRDGSVTGLSARPVQAPDNLDWVFVQTAAKRR